MAKNARAARASRATFSKGPGHLHGSNIVDVPEPTMTRKPGNSSECLGRSQVGKSNEMEDPSWLGEEDIVQVDGSEGDGERSPKRSRTENEQHAHS